MSVIEGAFAVTVPAAAHMPGGGEASIAFMLAVLMRPATEVLDALVDARDRFAEGPVGVALEVVGVLRAASG